MSKFIVEGGHTLSGEIRPQGAKNEALEVLSAVLLTESEVRISNVPEILDVKNLIALLQGSADVALFLIKRYALRLAERSQLLAVGANLLDVSFQ